MIEIQEIKGRKALRRFIDFAMNLYLDNECYVPPLLDDELNSLDMAKNPAFDFCESVYYMAVRDGKDVGRIAGFINHRYNDKFSVSQCRFGFVDFIDDMAVSKALLDAVRDWGQRHQLTSLVGPLGLTDLDYEGCLIEGFDQLGTASTIYNYPYYRKHFEQYGLVQDAVWNEYKMAVPEMVPEKHKRIGEIILKKYNLRVIKPESRRKLVQTYGQRIFQLLNQCYAPLYGFVELTQRQIDYYISIYLPLVRLNMIRLIVDSGDDLIGFGICLPSLAKAQQKARGHLFPFGFIHLLKAMYGHDNPIMDLYLIGVRPDYQGKGVNALFFIDIIPQAIKNGYKWVESNPELATNFKVQDQWQYFSPTKHKQRCTFKMDI